MFDISLLSNLLANITVETKNNIDITPQTSNVSGAIKCVLKLCLTLFLYISKEEEVFVPL